MLEIKNLTCGYGADFNLRQISLKIEQGEFVGVIGPNGSGKTTLLKAISRILKPKEGGVFIGKKDIGHLGFKDLARVMALVAQSPVMADISVEDYVLLGRIPYLGGLQFIESKYDLEVARRCLDLTGTFDLRERLFTEISGGERQLVLIARALAQEPRLLLLDEPTAHLDIAHQVHVMGLIRKLNRDLGLTVIVVLHDLNLAAEYCRRLVLINAGRLQRIGEPEEVLDYKTIEEVYKTTVVTGKNPVSLKPYIFLVSGEENIKHKTG